MAFTMPEANASSTVRKRAIEELLVRGREWASQLQLGMLRGSSTATTTTTTPCANYAAATNSRSSSPHHAHQDDLVAKILESFTQALSILLNSGGEADEVSRLLATAAGMNSPCSPSCKPSQQDSSELSCKPCAAPKDRRGCYKRRRTSETWSTESPTLVDDGHAWRKYGQKAILNAEYPRNYFRCTHKYDQGCQATKQVQKIQDDPLVFRTTYHARHTCKNLLLLQQQEEEQAIASATTRATTASATPRDSSILLSFESSSSQVPPSMMFMMMTNQSSLAKAAVGSGSGGGDDGLLPVPVPVPALKQEEMNKEELFHTDPSTSTSTTTLFRNQPSSSSSSSDHDHFLPQEDFTTFETSDPLTLAEGSDHGDVIPSGVYSSCTTATSTQSLEMDHMVMVVNDFDDFSQFEFDT